MAAADLPAAPQSGNSASAPHPVTAPQQAPVPQNTPAAQAVRSSDETAVPPAPVTTPAASVSLPTVAAADLPAAPQSGNSASAPHPVTAPQQAPVPQNTPAAQAVRSSDETAVPPAPVTTPAASVSLPTVAAADLPATPQSGNSASAPHPVTPPQQAPVPQNTPAAQAVRSTPSVMPSEQSVGEVAALPVSTPVATVADIPVPLPSNDLTAQQNATVPQFATQTAPQNIIAEPLPATAFQTVPVQQPALSNGETDVPSAPNARPDTPVSRPIHVVADSPAPLSGNDVTVQQNVNIPQSAVQTVTQDANVVQAAQSNGEAAVTAAPITTPDTRVSQPLHVVADSPVPLSGNDVTVQPNATAPQFVTQTAPQNMVEPQPVTVQQPVQSNGETVVPSAPNAMPDTPVSLSVEAPTDVQAPRVVSEASVKHPSTMPETSQPTPQGTRFVVPTPITKSDKIVSEDTTEIDTESFVLQAAPVSQPPQAIDVNPLLSPEAVQAATATAARARTLELVEAVEAVAETIRVSPGDLRGEGEVRIFLKSNVLDGSEIRLEAKSGTLSVTFHPATPDVAQLIEQNRAQLEMRLAERVHSYQVSVSVKKGKVENETV